MKSLEDAFDMKTNDINSNLRSTTHPDIHEIEISRSNGFCEANVIRCDFDTKKLKTRCTSPSRNHPETH